LDREAQETNAPMKNRLALLALIVAAASARAAVTFEPAKNFPNIGFMLPRLARAKGEPTPMPRAHAYLLVGEEGLLPEDRFDPYELWFNTQCCARWRDAEGNRLLLGRATHRLPTFAEAYVSRDVFGSSLSDAENLVDPKNRDHLTEWVATFVDRPVFAPEALKLNRFALDEVLRFPCEEKGTFVYAFLPRRVGNAEPFDWFCAVLRLSGEADAAAMQAQFEASFLANIALPPRTSKSKGVEAAELSAQRGPAKAVDQPLHPVRVEARKSVDNYDDWWFAETDGHIILSDVATEAGRSVVRELQDKLPVFRQAYARLVPPLTAADEISLVRLFESREDYVRYVGPEQAWSGGLWMPARRELVLFQQSSKDDLMRIIRHEAFHQYLSYATCMLGAPPWLNEGHACLFENSRLDGKGKVRIEEDAERGRLLTENLDTAVTLLPFLLQDTYESFYAANPDVRRLKYAMAWGFTYYLQKGVPEETRAPAATLLADYVAALAETRDPALASAAALAGVDMAALQERFRLFWIKGREKASRFDPLD